VKTTQYFSFFWKHTRHSAGILPGHGLAETPAGQQWGQSMPSPTDTQPTIVAFAGRRIDSYGAKATRFPFANVDALRAAIGTSLERIALPIDRICGLLGTRYGSR
jgi:hypothetical protein